MTGTDPFTRDLAYHLAHLTFSQQPTKQKSFMNKTIVTMPITAIIHATLKVKSHATDERVGVGRCRLTCSLDLYLFNHGRTICAELECNTRRCCWRYAGADCQIKPRTAGQVPAAVARQLEAGTARRRAGIIAEKLAKDPAPSRGTSDTLQQLLQPPWRWHS